MPGAERVQMSLRVPAEMIEKFERIAGALDRDRTWVMLQAFQYFLDREGAELLIDAEGIAAVDRGETVDLDTALKGIDAAIAEGVQARRKKAG